MGCSKISYKREVYSSTILPQEIRKISKSLTLYLSQLEKEQAKPKVIRRKEKDESRNKLHNRKQLQRSMKLYAGSWKR